MAMYHWEADQDDFLVLAGEALLIVEGQGRALGQWDLVHCPAGTKHVIVGAGDAACLVLAVGARDRRGHCRTSSWLLQEAVELDDSAGRAVAERRVGEEALRGAAAARQPPGLVSGGCEPEFGGCGA